MKHQLSETGVANAHQSYENDEVRIFVHIVPEKKKYPAHPKLLQFRYCRSDGSGGWDILQNGSLDLKEGETKNNAELKNWLEKIGKADQARTIWNLYVNLKDGRL